MNTFRALLLAGTVSLIAACSSTPSKPAAPVAPPAPAVSVGGNWSVTIDSQMGAQDSKLALNQNGNALTGTLDTPMGSQAITGTFDGKEIKFSFNVNAQGMDLKIDFIGVSDGKQMSGKAVFGSFGEGTFKGTHL